MARSGKDQAARAVVLLFMLACLFSVLPSAFSLIEQDTLFTIVLDATPSSFEPGFSIYPNTPFEGEYVTPGRVMFNFIVRFNTSLASLACNLTLDNVAIKENMDGMRENYVETVRTLTQGSHAWNVACADSNGVARASESRSFTADLTPPAVQLTVPDGQLFLTDKVDLNFTPIDNYAQSMYCNLTLNSASQVWNMLSYNSTGRSIHLDDVPNGNYAWNVACTDHAGLIGTSETRNFVVDMNTNFTLSLSKSEFNLGELGYYIITGPPEGVVYLIINDPANNSRIKSFSNQYPVVDVINFTEHPGTYTLEAVLSYRGGTQIVRKSLQVLNSLSADIAVANIQGLGVNDNVNFQAIDNGGFDPMEYRWDFGDGAVGSGIMVSHVYPVAKAYPVRLTVTDAKGNTASAAKDIRIKTRYPLLITVKDAETNVLLNNVLLAIEGEYHRSGASGELSLTRLEGNYDVFAQLEGYMSKVTRLVHTGSTNATMLLDKVRLANITINESEILDGLNASNMSETLKEIARDAGISLPSKDPADVAAEVEEINKLVSVIESVQAEIRLMASDGREIADALEITKWLDNSKLNLKRAARDLDGLRYLKTQGEIAPKRQELLDDVEKIRAKMVYSINVLETEDFVKYPTSQEIEDRLREYLVLNNRSTEVTKDLKEYRKRIKELQLILTTKSKSYKVVLNQGLETEKVITALVSDVQLSAKTNASFLLFIPEELAESADEIEVITPHAVVKQGRILGFDVTQTPRLVLSFSKDLELAKLKDITPLLLHPPEQKRQRKGLLSITGLSFAEQYRKIENKQLVLEIAVIVLLILIYVGFQFELASRIRKFSVLHNLSYLTTYLPFRNKLVREIEKELRQARTLLEESKVDEADVLYHQLISTYNTSLSHDQKTKVFPKIDQLFNDIIIARIGGAADQALAFLNDSQVTYATDKYKEVSLLYNQLSISNKAKVADRCGNLHKDIMKTKERLERKE